MIIFKLHFSKKRPKSDITFVTNQKPLSDKQTPRNLACSFIPVTRPVRVWSGQGES